VADNADTPIALKKISQKKLMTIRRRLSVSRGWQEGDGIREQRRKVRRPGHIPAMFE
jgi:hypothetical protein